MMTNDLKTERLRGLIKELKKAEKDIGPAGVKNGKISENLLFPLMVLFNTAATLLFVASEQDPDWKDVIERFTGKGE